MSHLKRLQQTQAGWTAVDVGSRNGTPVDGKRLEPSTPVQLASGAQIRLGGVKLTFLSASGLFRRLTAVWPVGDKPSRSGG